MHFNIYLDNDTAEKLKTATEKSHESRNAIIRQAINQWLDQTQNKTWPKNIIDFTGLDEMPTFESHRKELSKPNEDPFA